jgi:hypothetical protein
MNYDGLVQFIQGHFSDGLVLVIGSGLSIAEGIPGMPALATYLSAHALDLSEGDKAIWIKIQTLLDADEGLEAALLKHPPSPTLEEWIVRKTCDLLLPKEREVMSAVVAGTRTLRLSILLSKILKPRTGLPILTPNYDRLIELACEMAGLHVDTTAVGHYAGAFDHERSCMGSCKRIITRGKISQLEHFPRAVVLKPHGSLDWYRANGVPRRCSLDLDTERLIITPGLNKYRAGYNAPFDKHRDLANDHIKKAARLLIVGYGFNDDHLQTHLEQRIKDGTPTLILALAATARAKILANEAPMCVCISKTTASDGVAVVTRDVEFERHGTNLWDIEILSKECLA